jgi:signal transduction histidine kinase
VINAIKLAFQHLLGELQTPVDSPTLENVRAEALRAILHTHEICLAYIAFIYAPFFASDVWGAYGYVVAWLLTLLAIRAALTWGKLRLAAQLLCWPFIIIVTVLALMSPPTQYMFYFPAVIHFAVFFGLRAGLIALTGSVLICAFIAFGGASAVGIPRVFSAPPLSQIMLLVIELVMMVVPVYVLARNQQRSLAQLAKELEARSKAEQELWTINLSLEKTIEARTAELKESNAELAAFSHRVAHDLRGAIGQVSGFTTLAQRKLEKGQLTDASELLIRSQQASERMLALLERMLSLAQGNSLATDLTEVPLREVADSIVADIKTNAGSTVRFQVDGEGSALADPVLIREVLNNLIGNAVKFSSKNDAASVKVAIGPSANDPTMVEASVADNGVGFDPKNAAKLFVPFERLHHQRDFPGFGLGLATCRRIIALHGGTIEALNRPGGGAEFRFTLRRAERPRHVV